MGQDLPTDLSPYSTPDTFGIKDIRAILEKYCTGKRCLDIGCGTLPRPAYMIEETEWAGIDPLDGERDFEFVQSDAENIPFEDSIFDEYNYHLL